MSDRLQIVLIIASLITFIIILRNIYRSKMDIKYAILWITLAFFIAILSIFPRLLDEISSLVGIYAPTNTLFLATIFIAYCLMFYIYISISSNNKKIKKMNYEIAELKKQLDEVKKGE
jgi:hypothetical protein